MRKWSFIIIISYLLLALIFILIAPKRNENLKILVKKQYYSQIITENECLELPVYLSERNTFFTSLSAIDDVRLISDDNELQVTIDSIEDLGIKTQYESDDYYVYRLVIDVSEYATLGLSMQFTDAVLAITYQNQETIRLLIGEVNFTWDSINPNSDFDYYRLGGLFGQFNDKEIMEGIVIGFDQFIPGDIIINKITLGIDEIYLDIEKMIPYEVIEEFQSLYQTLGDDYQFDDFDSIPYGSSIIIEPNVLYAIPFRYQDLSLQPRRFPVIIDYQKAGEMKQFIIDDFVFKSENVMLSEDFDNVSIVNYRYRD